MSAPELLLFGVEKQTATGKVQLVATLVDGRVVVSAVDGETRIDMRLDTEHAIGLGAALLDAAGPEAIAAFAERMDQRIAQTIAAGLLVPTATRGLLAAADTGPEASS